MAGEFKVNGVSFATESGGTLTVNNSKVRLPSSGNGIEDSSGNSVLSESGGNVSLTAKNATVTGDFVPSNSFMFRNKIINGNFDFWQRGTSQTSSGYGSTDRWGLGHATSSKTASQQSFANGQTDVPGNPKYYLRHVVTSSSGGYVYAGQPIEGVETLSGKTVTLSFYAKADSNKNIATEFQQYFGSGGSPSSQITGIGVTTHNLTTSWQKFTVTTTIPSISGKTIGTNSNDYLALNFWFEAGSSLNSRTNSLGQQSGTFDIAQVQVEEGSSATPFEHRPIGMELSLCQRYFEKMLIVGRGIYGQYSSNGGTGDGAAFHCFFIPYKVTKRATPTIPSTTSNNAWAIISYSNYSSQTTHTFRAQSVSTEGFAPVVDRVSGGNGPSLANVYGWQGSVTYNIDAEL